MVLLIVISIILFVGIAVIVAGNQKETYKPAEPTTVKSEVTTEPKVFTDIMDREVQDIYIAGLAHHCTRRDVGVFVGTVYNEKDNPVDRKAMAIGDNNKKKILGYVPGAVLDDFRKWCKREKCPCIGFIYWDGEHLRGRVRVYHPSADLERANEDGEKYASIVNEHFGWK